MKERFEEIYAENEWAHGSGEGSLPVHTKGYVDFLERFIADREIRSVVDLGCGDWQFSRHVRWAPTHYHGFDVVSSIVRDSGDRYGSADIEFHLCSGDPDDLPAAHLLIAKDVLQHWSTQSVTAFLPVLARFKYALLTNCVDPRGPTANIDIEDGGFRYLDLRLAPFHLQASELYSFTNRMGPLEKLYRRPRWLKRVLLVEKGGAAQGRLAS